MGCWRSAKAQGPCLCALQFWFHLPNTVGIRFSASQPGLICFEDSFTAETGIYIIHTKSDGEERAENQRTHCGFSLLLDVGCAETKLEFYDRGKHVTMETISVSPGNSYSKIMDLGIQNHGHFMQRRIAVKCGSRLTRSMK